jgi:hypothetical protein
VNDWAEHVALSVYMLHMYHRLSYHTHAYHTYEVLHMRCATLFVGHTTIAITDDNDPKMSRTSIPIVSSLSINHADNVKERFKFQDCILEMGIVHLLLRRRNEKKGDVVFVGAGPMACAPVGPRGRAEKCSGRASHHHDVNDDDVNDSSRSTERRHGC